MLKSGKYKLIQEGYPNENVNWFDGVLAGKFEDSVFKDKMSAEKEVEVMCRLSGTDADSNYDEFKPSVVTLGEFNAMFGDESENVFYW